MGIDCYISHRKLQLKPHSSPWFTPSCAAPIAHRNHYFHQHHRNATPENKKLFCYCRNHCKRALKEAWSNYAETTRRHVASQLIVSRDFWRICNSVLNKGKSTLFNGSEVLTTSTDKVDFFARNFSCNSTFDDGSHSFPIFHLVLNRDLALRISTILSLRCVLQSFILFLLSYTINAWPNLVFLPVGNLHRLCQCLKMMERDLIQVSIVLSTFFLLLVRPLGLLLMIT